MSIKVDLNQAKISAFTHRCENVQTYLNHRMVITISAVRVDTLTADMVIFIRNEDSRFSADRAYYSQTVPQGNLVALLRADCVLTVGIRLDVTSNICQYGNDPTVVYQARTRLCITAVSFRLDVVTHISLKS